MYKNALFHVLYQNCINGVNVQKSHIKLEVYLLLLYKEFVY